MDRGFESAISPGPIETPAFNRLAKTEDEIRQIRTNLVAAVPIGRIRTPDEIAYITGIELFVDGGMAQI